MTGRLPGPLASRLRLPLVAAPMFLVSGPDLVIAACRAGVIGSFPFPNARTAGDLRLWLDRLKTTLGPADAPWAANLMVHPTYARLDEEVALVEEYRPEIVITALGSPRRMVDVVRRYGGIVLADVNSPVFARKAIDAGVDGLVLVAAGAGGHTGPMSPFAFVAEVRRHFDGIIALAGSLATGRAVRAAQVLGADLGYVGTPFIAAEESLAPPAYREMLVAAGFDDILLTDAFTGVKANMLIPAIRAAGLDPAALRPKERVEIGDPQGATKAWKNIWSAGHGVGSITAIEPAAAIVERFARDYAAAVAEGRKA
ncbi:MAG: nitronate monooxygenase [Alphaproteobacteria bacterium]|jgi:nitronate monooxygenase|nr:nitronate monooxygenase [Alphaproteobacteria bacterium]